MTKLYNKYQSFELSLQKFYYFYRLTNFVNISIERQTALVKSSSCSDVVLTSFSPLPSAMKTCLGSEYSKVSCVEDINETPPFLVLLFLTITAKSSSEDFSKTET